MRDRQTAGLLFNRKSGRRLRAEENRIGTIRVEVITDSWRASDWHADCLYLFAPGRTYRGQIVIEKSRA